MEAIYNIIPQAVIVKLGWTLIHFLWQGVLLMILLAIVLRLLKSKSSNVRYLVSCVALLLMVSLPVVTIGLIKVEPKVSPPVTFDQPIEAGPPVVETLEYIEPMPVETIRPEYVAPVEPKIASVEPDIPLTERLVTFCEPLLPFIVIGYFLGVFALSIWHLGGWCQLQRLRRNLTTPVNEKVLSRVTQFSKLLHIKAAVEVFQSALVAVPTVIGAFKPVILLPASVLTGLSAEQLDAVIAHELAHIKRHDYLVNIFQTIIEILGFYHPAVWWVSNKIRAERENCCDDLAVNVTGDSVQYAKALATMEELKHSPRLAVAASGANLFNRIMRLLGKDNNKNQKTGWLAPAAVLLITVLIIVSSAISFAGNKTNIAIDEQTDKLNDADKQDDKKYTIKLDNDITVELLGICEHPSEGKQWWSPDGTLLDFAPYRKLEDGEAYKDLQLYEIIYRLNPSESTISKINRTNEIPGYFGPYPVSRQTEGVHDNFRKCLYAYIPVQGAGNQVDLSFACGTEKNWHWILRIESPVDRSGMNTNNADINVSVGQNKQIIAHVTHKLSDMEVRVVAMDRDGLLHQPVSVKSKGMEFVNVITAEFDLKVDETARVEVQTQKLLPATFKNVSLRPGVKTDVEIESSVPIVASSEQKAKKQTGDDIAPFVGSWLLQQANSIMQIQPDGQVRVFDQDIQPYGTISMRDGQVIFNHNGCSYKCTVTGDVMQMQEIGGEENNSTWKRIWDLREHYLLEVNSSYQTLDVESGQILELAEGNGIHHVIQQLEQAGRGGVFYINGSDDDDTFSLFLYKAAILKGSYDTLDIYTTTFNKKKLPAEVEFISWKGYHHQIQILEANRNSCQLLTYRLEKEPRQTQPLKNTIDNSLRPGVKTDVPIAGPQAQAIKVERLVEDFYKAVAESCDTDAMRMLMDQEEKASRIVSMMKQLPGVGDIKAADIYIDEKAALVITTEIKAPDGGFGRWAINIIKDKGTWIIEEFDPDIEEEIEYFKKDFPDAAHFPGSSITSIPQGTPSEETDAKDEDKEDITVDNLISKLTKAVRPYDSMKVEWEMENFTRSGYSASNTSPTATPPPLLAHKYKAVISGYKSFIEDNQFYFEDDEKQKLLRTLQKTHVFDGQKQKILEYYKEGSQGGKKYGGSRYDYEKNFNLLTDILYGWSTDIKQLRQRELSEQRKGYFFEIIHKSKDDLYTLNINDPNNGGTSIWTIDPKKNFNIIKIVRQTSDASHTYYEKNFKYKKYDNDIWYLDEYEFIRYPARGRTGEPLLEYQVKINNVEFDIDVPESTFELEFPKGARVWDGHLNDWVIIGEEQTAAAQAQAIKVERLVEDFYKAVAESRDTDAMRMLMDQEEKASRIVSMMKRLPGVGDIKAADIYIDEKAALVITTEIKAPDGGFGRWAINIIKDKGTWIIEEFDPDIEEEIEYFKKDFSDAAHFPGSSITSISQGTPSGETEVEVESSDWKELTLPDIDGSDSPAILDLNTGEMIPFASRSDSEAYKKFVEMAKLKPDRCYLMYEYAQNQANLMIIDDARIFDVDGNYEQRPMPIVHVISDSLPCTFTMTNSQGQVYEFTVLQTDNTQCRLRYGLHPDDETAAGTLIEDGQSKNYKLLLGQGGTGYFDRDAAIQIGDIEFKVGARIEARNVGSETVEITSDSRDGRLLLGPNGTGYFDRDASVQIGDALIKVGQRIVVKNTGSDIIEIETIKQQAEGEEVFIAENYAAELPKSGKIELVSVCEFIKEGEEVEKKFWKPDGSEQPEPMYGSNSRYSDIKESQRYISLVFRSDRKLETLIVNTEDGIESNTLTKDYSVRDKEGKSIYQGNYLSYSGAIEDRDFTNIRLRIQPNSWETIASYDGKYVIGTPDKRIEVIESYETTEGAKLVFHSFTEAIHEIQVVAEYYEYTENNRPLNRRSSSRPTPATHPQGRKVLISTFRNIKLADIKLFRIQIRPKKYEFVEFRNISLSPGVKTDRPGKGLIESITLGQEKINIKLGQGPQKENEIKEFGSFLKSLLEEKNRSVVIQTTETTPQEFIFEVTNQAKLAGATDVAVIHPQKKEPQDLEKNTAGRLEFAIAVFNEKKDERQISKIIHYVEVLAAKGPIEGKTAEDGDYAWYKLRKGTQVSGDVVSLNYQGGEYLYVLVHNKEPFLMKPQQGWGLENVYVGKDNASRPAIYFHFDEKGAELFYNLTKENLKKNLAIIVDGQVVAAPVIMDALSSAGVIAGNFTQAEAEKIAQALKTGMPPKSSAAKDAGEKTVTAGQDAEKIQSLVKQLHKAEKELELLVQEVEAKHPELREYKLEKKTTYEGYRGDGAQGWDEMSLDLYNSTNSSDEKDSRRKIYEETMTLGTSIYTANLFESGEKEDLLRRYFLLDEAKENLGKSFGISPSEPEKIWQKLKDSMKLRKPEIEKQILQWQEKYKFITPKVWDHAYKRGVATFDMALLGMAINQLTPQEVIDAENKVKNIKRELTEIWPQWSTVHSQAQPVINQIIEEKAKYLVEGFLKNNFRNVPVEESIRIEKSKQVMDEPEKITAAAQKLFASIKGMDYEDILTYYEDGKWKQQVWETINIGYTVESSWPDFALWICKTFSKNPIASIELGDVFFSEKEIFGNTGWPTVPYKLTLADNSIIQGQLPFQYYVNKGSEYWHPLHGIDFHLQDSPVKPAPKLSDQIILKLLDSSGQPVSGAKVGSSVRTVDWKVLNSNKLSWRLPGVENNVSDEQGLVVLSREKLFPSYWAEGRKHALFTMHEEKQIAAFCEIAKDDTRNQIILTLEPVCHIQGKLGSEFLQKIGDPLLNSNLYLSFNKDSHGVLSSSPVNNQFEFFVPPGQYDINAYGYSEFGATRHVTKKIEVTQGQSKLNVGDIDLPPDRITELIGKSAPQLDSVKAWKNGPVKLADLKGKVVILYFDGDLPNTSRDLPELVELHDQLADKGLVIIALYNNPSMESLELEWKEVYEKYGGVQDVPFRVAVDGGKSSFYEGSGKERLGATYGKYDITISPTTVLIDPQGNVVGYLNLFKAEETVKKMLGIGPFGLAKDQWRKRFNEVYQLEDGHILKRIAPPFVPERNDFYNIEEASQAKSISEPPDYFTFRWDGMLKKWGYGFTGNRPLASVLTSNLSLKSDWFECPQELARIDVPGDWIMRMPSTMEQRLKALESILANELGRNIKFEKRMVTRDVIVAEGQFKFNPHDDKRFKDSVVMYSDEMDPDEGAGGGTADNITEFLDAIGARTGFRVIDNTHGDKDIIIPYYHHDSAYLTRVKDPQEKMSKLKLLLDNLTKQTGLQFKVEPRQIEMWFVTEQGQNEDKKL